MNLPSRRRYWLLVRDIELTCPVSNITILHATVQVWQYITYKISSCIVLNREESTMGDLGQRMRTIVNFPGSNNSAGYSPTASWLPYVMALLLAQRLSPGGYTIFSVHGSV
jgi:hypothetical protein